MWVHVCCARICVCCAHICVCCAHMCVLCTHMCVLCTHVCVVHAYVCVVHTCVCCAHMCVLCTHVCVVHAYVSVCVVCVRMDRLTTTPCTVTPSLTSSGMKRTPTVTVKPAEHTQNCHVCVNVLTSCTTVFAQVLQRIACSRVKCFHKSIHAHTQMQTYTHTCTAHT